MSFVDRSEPSNLMAQLKHLQMLLEDQKISSRGGTPMELGVRLCYLIWASQDRQDKDRKIHVDVVKNIYPELAKTSPLFGHWERSGVRADDVVRMLTHESNSVIG